MKHMDGAAIDSHQSDRYEDDEDQGLPVPGGFSHCDLGMRFAHGPRLDAFEQPDYHALGGVGCKWRRKLQSLLSAIRNPRSIENLQNPPHVSIVPAPHVRAAADHLLLLQARLCNPHSKPCPNPNT